MAARSRQSNVAASVPEVTELRGSYDDIKDIAIFVCVVKSDSFTRAAQAMRISTATVSKHISRLEQRLGVKLLSRSTHRFFLTEPGISLYERCSKLMSDFYDARRAVIQQEREISGLLRVQCTPGIGPNLIGPMTAKFVQCHPALSAEFVVVYNRRSFIQEQFDVAIHSRNTRPVELAGSSVDYCEIGPLRYVICAAPAYLKDAPTLSIPSDLSAHNCILQTRHAGTETWRFTGPSGIYTVNVDGSFYGSDTNSILAATLIGLGPALLPEYMVARKIAAGKLIALFAGQSVSDNIIRAFYPKTERLPAKVEAYIQFLKGNLP